MRLKRLNIERWMYLEYSEHKETKVYANKEGLYAYGMYSWFEIKVAGKIRAFEYDVEDFRFTLLMRKTAEYNTLQYNALKNIVKNKLATKTQVTELRFIEYNRENRVNKYRNMALKNRMLKNVAS